MNHSFNQKKINFIIDVAYIAAIVFAFYIFLKYLFGIITPFLLAILFSYIAEPIINSLSDKLRLKRSICSAVCITILFLLIICLLSFAVYVICLQLPMFFSFIPDIVNDIESYFEKLSTNGDSGAFEKILIQIKEYISSFDMKMLSESGITDKLILYFADIFKSLPRILMTIIVTFTFSLFFSSSFPLIKAFIKNRFSLKNRKLLHNVKESSITILKKYFRSYTLLMLITFIELFIAFLIFDIKPAVALALIISLIDILPVFGVGTVMIPWGLICLITGDFTMAAIILSIYAVISVVRQIIEPKIIGKSIGLPPVVTLPVMFIGFSLFGITGLFAAPIIATILYDLHSKGYIF